MISMLLLFKLLSSYRLLRQPEEIGINGISDCTTSTFPLQLCYCSYSLHQVHSVACLPRNSHTIPTSWMVTNVCCLLVTAMNKFQNWILSQQPETLWFMLLCYKTACSFTILNDTKNNSTLKFILLSLRHQIHAAHQVCSTRYHPFMPSIATQNKSGYVCKYNTYGAITLLLFLHVWFVDTFQKNAECFNTRKVSPYFSNTFTIDNHRDYIYIHSNEIHNVVALIVY